MAGKNNQIQPDVSKNNLSRQTVHSIDPSNNTSRQTDDSEITKINLLSQTEEGNINTKSVYLVDHSHKQIDIFGRNDGYQYLLKSKAIAAFEKAEDSNNDERGAKEIATSKPGLENAKRQME